MSAPGETIKIYCNDSLMEILRDRMGLPTSAVRRLLFQGAISIKIANHRHAKLLPQQEGDIPEIEKGWNEEMKNARS